MTSTRAKAFHVCAGLGHVSVEEGVKNRNFPTGRIDLKASFVHVATPRRTVEELAGPIAEDMNTGTDAIAFIAAETALVANVFPFLMKPLKPSEHN